VMGFASHKDARQSIFLRICRLKKKLVTFFFSFFYCVCVNMDMLVEMCIILIQM
jgi:hypothetical protein